MNAKDAIHLLERRYEGLWERLEQMVTADEYFQLFKQLSDNYSPTLTVSRVQGPLVESLMARLVLKRILLELPGTLGVRVPSVSW